MFCERLHNDPEDECVYCAGRGFRSWWDADCGWDHVACPACEGTASAGTFVVELHVAHLRYQQSWESCEFGRAVARADRWAALLARSLNWRGLSGECRVVFLSDGGGTEEVYAVAVGGREPARAA